MSAVKTQLRKWLSVVGLLALAVVAMRLSLGAARTHAVGIKAMQFQPPSLSINAGDCVTWVNQDDRDHKLAAEDGTFQSANLPAGGTFSYTFSRAGEHRYGCAYHPREKGVIIVVK
jgi:plastocyanin